MAIGNLDGLTLAELLIGASEAPPNYRIQFRDPIAKFGAPAADALASWLLDASLGAFAARTIGRAGIVDRDPAVAVLKAALHLDLLPLIRTDVLEQLSLLGVTAQTAGPPKSQHTLSTAKVQLEALTVGHVYHRRNELHASGIGGNQQKGISYPAGGTYALLFSHPGKATEWGYNDRWDGDEAYWYYGEWDGSGDMTMIGGNQRIIDRSPHLYLFTAVNGGHRFEGTFRYDHHVSEMTLRDGTSARAIVFHLLRNPNS